MLRQALLFKHGGTYLDTDIVSLRSLSYITESSSSNKNFVVALDDGHSGLNNALLHFEQGSPFATLCLDDMSRTFDGNKKGQQGPRLLLRIVEANCHTLEEQGQHHRQWNCSELGLDVLPSATAYPIGVTQWTWIFEVTLTIRSIKIRDIGIMS